MMHDIKQTKKHFKLLTSTGYEIPLNAFSTDHKNKQHKAAENIMLVSQYKQTSLLRNASKADKSLVSINLDLQTHSRNKKEIFQ